MDKEHTLVKFQFPLIFMEDDLGQIAWQQQSKKGQGQKLDRINLDHRFEQE